MRVLIAPDKLKGSLTAVAAAAAMAQGVERACGCPPELLPLADGGEGTLDALIAARGGEVRRVPAHDALGVPCSARLGLLDRGRVAVVESADAIGLARLAGERRPLDATSFGVGELIAAALDLGVESIVVALGGSATNDGGVGAAQALGALFHGAPRPARARDLSTLGELDISRIDARLARVELTALCDVDSPLTGPAGASRVFGPQKGLSPADAVVLDGVLAELARQFAFDAQTPGAGAAGGLGFGLAAFAGAKLASGADYVLDAVQFDSRVRERDLVLTAEGRLDAQSLAGKLVIRVGERALGAKVPAVVLAGRIELSPAELAAHGLVAAFALGEGQVSEAESMARAAELLEAAAERAVTALGSGTARAARYPRAPS
ncbi:MAG: glycerate kinase [Myxococcales bacterium]|nr:glycerate kinase [Myxococcales bacterium]